MTASKLPTLPSVSLVVPTYNREEPLKSTLIDCVAQDYPNFEVIVVDQTKDHTPEVAEYLDAAKTAGKITLFTPDFASLPGARNYAIRRAKGDIIIFIDDDIRMDSHFIKSHVTVFLEKPEVGAVAGRVLPPAVDENKLKTFAVQQLPPEALDPGIAWYYLDFTYVENPQQVLSARGCNMSFRREVFDNYGLAFDERMQGSAIREESDLCLQVRKTGYDIWYEPNAALVHIGEPTGGCHNISTRTFQYQVTHYHNHFWMGFRNLTLWQNLRLYVRLFDCHVLGNPPCNKDKSLTKGIVRGVFYFYGFLSAVKTAIASLFSDGQIYSHQDPKLKEIT